MRGQDGALEHGSMSGGFNNFQGRYAIRHPWTGPIACEHPVREIGRASWRDDGELEADGRDEDGVRTRTGLQLAAFVRIGGAELGITPAPGLAPLPAPAPAPAPMPASSSGTVPSARRPRGERRVAPDAARATRDLAEGAAWRRLSSRFACVSRSASDALRNPIWGDRPHAKRACLAPRMTSKHARTSFAFCSGLGAVVALGSVVACVVDAPAGDTSGRRVRHRARSIRTTRTRSKMRRAFAYDVLTQHNDIRARARRSTRAR